MSIKLVTSDAQTRQRHHLDLYAANQAAAIARLMQLGAYASKWRYEPVAGPHGNRLCVVQSRLPFTSRLRQ